MNDEQFQRPTIYRATRRAKTLSPQRCFNRTWGIMNTDDKFNHECVYEKTNLLFIDNRRTGVGSRRVWPARRTGMANHLTAPRQMVTYIDAVIRSRTSKLGDHWKATRRAVSLGEQVANWGTAPHWVFSDEDRAINYCRSTNWSITVGFADPNLN